MNCAVSLVLSDSVINPLPDVNVITQLPMTELNETNVNPDDLDEMIEEQLDYEDFVENIDEAKIDQRTVEDVVYEDGECDSDDCHVGVIVTKYVPLRVIENETSDSATALNTKIVIDLCDSDSDNVDTKKELSEADDTQETPWERGLRLARERRELAKLKKIQEKDKWREKQLNMNLDGIAEVEPISKPLILETKEVNPKLLKAMQPIVILAEMPKEDEMMLEYYLSERSYQHRPRFIPTKLYTLDPWEVEEWKRELDMIKFEYEMTCKLKGKKKRHRRPGSCSSPAVSRSHSQILGRAMVKVADKNYEHRTSQYALSRKRSTVASTKPPLTNTSNNLAFISQRKRDMPPEFRNRVASSSRSTSRSSSSSYTSSSSSSSSTSNSPDRPEPPKRLPRRVARPRFQGVKKPVLGRARSDSFTSSQSSTSSSSTTCSSSSNTSDASKGSKTMNKSEPKNQFNKLNAATVQEPSVISTSLLPTEVDMDHNVDEKNVSLDGNRENNGLPSAACRPGVRLKIVGRTKPFMMPKTATPQKRYKDKKSTKDPVLTESSIAPSNIFANSGSIFSALSHNNKYKTEHTLSTKVGALKSSFASTQLEIQQDFLRNYKDKIAIYRSQLSYRQQNTLGQDVYTGNLTHTKPPPIKGPITVLSVTSKKTGPPKAAQKLADHYSKHEEQQSRRRHHSTSRHRDKTRHGHKHRSRSLEGKSSFDRGRHSDNKVHKDSDIWGLRNERDNMFKGNDRSFNDISNRGGEFYERNKNSVHRGGYRNDSDRCAKDGGQYEIERGGCENYRSKHENERGQYQNNKGRCVKDDGQYENGRGQYKNNRGRFEEDRGRYVKDDKYVDLYGNGGGRFEDDRSRCAKDGKVENQYGNSRSQYGNGRSQYENDRGPFEDDMSRCAKDGKVENQYGNGRNRYAQDKDQYENGRGVYESERGDFEDDRSRYTKGKYQHEKNSGRYEKEWGQYEYGGRRNDLSWSDTKNYRSFNNMERGRNNIGRARFERNRDRNNIYRDDYEMDRDRNDIGRCRDDVNKVNGADRERHTNEKNGVDKSRRENRNREFARLKGTERFDRGDRPREQLRARESDRDRDVDLRLTSRSGDYEHTGKRFMKHRLGPLNTASDSVDVQPVKSLLIVPKDRRRAELLLQLKAVEDAIAKKKAKIDK